MSDVIQLLPDSVANQIAAGEVIQRPASVIKELMENAVDAGATHIHVLVIDAGRTSIQVIDDGKGMSETDARLAFERHATSKIREAADLFALRTMGFRGEALPSIVAVSQVQLKTRQAGEDIGTHLTLSASKVDSQEPCACPVGCNFMVENLFFNVPARRKFLKSNTTELNNIITAFERIALVNPQIAFTLHSNGGELFNLKAGGLRQRIVDVFGKKINQALLPVGVDTTMCRISGFVGKPEAARKKGALQYFFVNGRYMKHPYFAKAVQTAFERLVPMGEQVPFFIYFEVPPEDIDVNIHPTKTEIKFENEQHIWQMLLATVKEAVGLFSDVPTIDFDTHGKPDIPVFQAGGHIAAPKVQYDVQYNPFKNHSAPKPSPDPGQWGQLYEGLLGGQEDEPSLFQPSEETPASGSIIAEKSPAHYQYKGKYIMTAVKSGLMIIDQYRAHVRILYEQYEQLQREKKACSQKMLFPEVLTFSPSDMVLLRKLLPELTAMGFELTDLGGNSYALNSVPAGVEGIDCAALVNDMLADVAEKTTATVDAVRHSLALSLARSMAIPYGQVLTNEEMEGVVNGLFACSNVNYTPDGKQVFAILPQQEIEHLLS